MHTIYTDIVPLIQMSPLDESICHQALDLQRCNGRGEWSFPSKPGLFGFLWGQIKEKYTHKEQYHAHAPTIDQICIRAVCTEASDNLRGHENFSSNDGPERGRIIDKLSQSKIGNLDNRGYVWGEEDILTLL